MTPNRHALLIGINRYPFLNNKDLSGCVNDVQLMASLLLGRFGFAEERVQVVLDEQATRDGILAALDGLTDRVGEDDIAVVFYAGHGSRMRDPHGREDFLESMVSHDSGRGRYPNRDVLDYEIDQRIQRLNEKTPYVTLLFDCCHSGSVTRDLFGASTREIEPDTRSIEDMFGGEPMPPPPEHATRSANLDAAPSASGWVPGNRSAVLLAACKANELANEHAVGEGAARTSHGALTYFLSQRLLRAPADATLTWRDLFEQISLALSTEYPRQHPQLEGKVDEKIFGTESLTPSSYLQVREVSPAAVTLGGGAAHGVTVGSTWAIYSSDIHHAGEAGTELALVKISSVQAATSKGEILDPTSAASLAQGQRAFAREHVLVTPQLKVQITVPAARAADADVLRRALGASSLLAEASPGEPADVHAQLLPPRDPVGEGDPCPHLGPLEAWTWATVGTDGRLATKLRTPEEAALLAEDLEGVSRYRHLLQIENPDPASALRDQVRLVIKRWVPSRQTFVETATERDGGLVVFEEGEKAEFEIHNDADRDVYVSLVQFGTDGQIGVLMPYLRHPNWREGGQRVPAGATYRVAADHFNTFLGDFAEGLPLHLPEGFPWAAEPGEAADSGQVTLKLFVTPVPADFQFLTQRETRSIPGNPLEAVAMLYSSGKGTRSFMPEPAATAPRTDWTTVTRAVAVRRPTVGETISDEVKEVAPGIVLKAPGLAGTVVFQRGESARTRDLHGASPLLDALGGAGLQTFATLEIQDTEAVATRSIEDDITTADGEPALALSVPRPAADTEQLVLYTDESGFMRWVYPEEGAGAAQRFVMPREVVTPPPGEATATRSLATVVGKKVLQIVGWKRVERAVTEAVAGRMARWEQERSPHRVRPFGSDDYALPPTVDFSEADWQRMAEGPALLMVHGTFSSTHAAFCGFDQATIARFHEVYQGRVFAFDHPTVTVDPEVNVRWFLDQVPPGLSLTLDVISHSRGGLVARTLSEWGPTLSAGRVQTRRVIMAGTPNRGTRLAHDEHMGALLDTFTNVINLWPAPGPVDLLMGVLEVAKSLALGLVGTLEGLQSMHPEGAFLKRLNAPQLHPPETRYYALCAAYGEGGQGYEQLGEGFRSFALKTLTGAIFGEDNDLVVPTGGVHEANGSLSFPLDADRQVLRFGVEAGPAGIWHGDYFAQPEGRAQILSWLSEGLVQGPVALSYSEA